jgi:hypothetical protein
MLSPKPRAIPDSIEKSSKMTRARRICTRSFSLSPLSPSPRPPFFSAYKVCCLKRHLYLVVHALYLGSLQRSSTFSRSLSFILSRVFASQHRIFFWFGSSISPFSVYLSVRPVVDAVSSELVKGESKEEKKSDQVYALFHSFLLSPSSPSLSTTECAERLIQLPED